ncbi:MAG: hypothetical protein AB7O62_04990 [Pirellulales bacterium]
MDNQISPELSAHDAARIIYNTPRPTPQQVGQVRLRLVQGHLKPGRGGTSTTTAAAIAEYMTTVAVGKQQKLSHEEDLKGVYRDLFRDYFMAVVSRRRITGRSPMFQHAVLIGQVATILFAAAALWWIYRHSIVPIPPEQKIVRAAIEEQYGSVKFHEWFPTVPAANQQGEQVRVQFTYFSSSRKAIRTVRTYQVVAGQAQDVTGADSD